MRLALAIKFYQVINVIKTLIVFSGKSEAEKQRDAKKQQRQQELDKRRAARQQGGGASGAMKLGTKKVTKEPDF